MGAEGTTFKGTAALAQVTVQPRHEFCQSARVILERCRNYPGFSSRRKRDKAAWNQFAATVACGNISRGVDDGLNPSRWHFAQECQCHVKLVTARQADANLIQSGHLRHGSLRIYQLRNRRLRK